jgi:hypothetical protein
METRKNRNQEKRKNEEFSDYFCDFFGCKKYLINPITLPCGQTVCKEHLNDSLEKIKCPFCDYDHMKPKEGFQVNIKMNSLINKNFHLTGQHKQVKEMFDELEIEIDDFKKTSFSHKKKDIEKVFSTIRGKVVLHRDQMIEVIQKRSEEILNELKGFEDEYNENCKV